MNFFGEDLFYDPLQLHYYQQPKNHVNEQELALINQMRNLWQLHITWTRTTISSLIFHLADADVVTERLVKTGTDMGDSLAPYYGDMVAHTYGQLLKEHVELAGDLVKEMITNNNKKSAEIELRWYQNADEVVVFLSRFNPFVDKEEFKKMFYAHLKLIKSEIVYMMNYDFNADVKTFDKMAAEGLEMADMISGAIRQQFDL